MEYDILLENVRRVINKAEVELLFSLKENLNTLYWEIGFELKELSKKEARMLFLKLSRDLDMNASIFELSHDYYKNHQVHGFWRKK